MIVAFITGQSRGLGRVLAIAFRKAGYSVPVCTRAEMDQDNADSIDFFTAQLSKIDVLINCAAILGPVGKFEDTNMGSWELTLTTNLMGPVRVTHEALRKMDSGGRIINIAGGAVALPRRSAYAASKAGLIRFTECIAEELKERGIAANCVLPGPLPTDMRQEIVDAGETVELTGPEALRRAVALCLYLASSESDGLTGKTISARYDELPFSESAKHAMAGSDALTLRRLPHGYQTSPL